MTAASPPLLAALPSFLTTSEESSDQRGMNNGPKMAGSKLRLNLAIKCFEGFVID